MARFCDSIVFIAFAFSQVHVEVQSLAAKEVQLKNLKPVSAKTYTLNLDVPPLER